MLVILILASSAALAVAQNSTNVPSNPDDQIGETKNYTALVTDLFAPITAALNLTKEQEFQIIATITSSQVTAEPLMQRFDEIERELVLATYVEPFDEARVRALSEQEAEIISQLILLRVLTKAKIYQILTPEQRILLLQSFGRKVPLQRH
jgi:Spy/CpxP family protein refolding chaperone